MTPGRISEHAKRNRSSLSEWRKRPNKSKPTSSHNVFYPAHSNCETCRMTKNSRARCRNRPELRQDGLDLHNDFGETITVGHQLLTEERIENATSRRFGSARPLFALASKLSSKEQEVGDTKKACNNSCLTSVKTCKNLHRQSSGVHWCLRRFELESTYRNALPL